jgi:hypothetical protein
LFTPGSVLFELVVVHGEGEATAHHPAVTATSVEDFFGVEMVGD